MADLSVNSARRDRFAAVPDKRHAEHAVVEVLAVAAPNDPEMAAAQAKLDALSEAMRARDWDAAEKALPAAAGVLPKRSTSVPGPLWLT